MALLGNAGLVLVVAAALVGRMDPRLENGPLGTPLRVALRFFDWCRPYYLADVSTSRGFVTSVSVGHLSVVRRQLQLGVLKLERPNDRLT